MGACGRQRMFSVSPLLPQRLLRIKLKPLGLGGKPLAHLPISEALRCTFFVYVYVCVRSCVCSQRLTLAVSSAVLHHSLNLELGWWAAGSSYLPVSAFAEPG